MIMNVDYLLQPAWNGSAPGAGLVDYKKLHISFYYTIELKFSNRC